MASFGYISSEKDNRQRSTILEVESRVGGTSPNGILGGISHSSTSTLPVVLHRKLLLAELNVADDHMSVGG